MQTMLLWLPLAILLAGAIAGLILAAICGFGARSGRSVPKPAAPGIAVFELHGEHVTHSNADDLVETLDLHDWKALRAWLLPRFPGLPERLSDNDGNAAERRQRFAAENPDDPAIVEIQVMPDGHRLLLQDKQPVSAAQRHEQLAEISRLRAASLAATTAPCASCLLDRDGTPIWQNAAFTALAPTEAQKILAAARTLSPGKAEEIMVTDTVNDLPGRQFRLSVADTGSARLVHVEDTSDLMRANAMRGSFIQTLTKTFAELSTGLAVFDRDQRLVLFNPAMLDLTGLPVEFLSSRPRLVEFFDRLRDRQVLPEPRNYATWRSQINDMIRSAADGNYSETWCLPSGLTYRISGRPHPDGAIAFLIEDVSDEISLSRRAKVQVEIRQAALDSVEEALAVIAPNGLLVFCNRALRELLGFDPGAGFAETSLTDLVRVCRRRFPDDAFWSHLTETGGTAKARARVNGPAGPILVRSEPLMGGFALLGLALPLREEAFA